MKSSDNATIFRTFLGIIALAVLAVLNFAVYGVYAPKLVSMASTPAMMLGFALCFLMFVFDAFSAVSLFQWLRKTPNQPEKEIS